MSTIPPARPLTVIAVEDHTFFAPEAPRRCWLCPSDRASKVTAVIATDAMPGNPTLLCEDHAAHVQATSRCSASFLRERWLGLRAAKRSIGDTESLTLQIAAGLRLGRGEDLSLIPE